MLELEAFEEALSVDVVNGLLEKADEGGACGRCMKMCGTCPAKGKPPTGRH